MMVKKTGCALGAKKFTRRFDRCTVLVQEIFRYIRVLHHTGYALISLPPLERREDTGP